MATPPLAVILPAAGQSSRFGGPRKKPYLMLDGRAVLLRTIELFASRDEVRQIVLLVAPEDREEVRQRFAANFSFLNVTLLAGGAERWESVARGLEALTSEVEYVIVHDAVRPCTPPAVIDAVIAAAVESGAAIAAVPVADTLKRADGQQRVRETVPRAGLWQAQTPQVFRKQLLLDAYSRRPSQGAGVTDDAQLVELLGHPVRLVQGSAQNLKITLPEDLPMAELILKSRTPPPPKPRGPFDEDWMR